MMTCEKEASIGYQLKDSASDYSLSCHVYNKYYLLIKSELVRKGALWIWSCWQALASARERWGTAAPHPCQGWVMGFVQIQEFFIRGYPFVVPHYSPLLLIIIQDCCDSCIEVGLP